MKLQTNYEKIENELLDVLRLFFPNNNEEEFPCVVHDMTVEKNKVVNHFEYKDENNNKEITKEYELPKNCDELEQKRLLKRYAKCALYELVSSTLNRKLPWGSLTGIRPTKVAYELIEKGLPRYFVKEKLMEQFFVSNDKAKLVDHVIRNQKSIIHNDNLVDLYINIPFCPTRCAYCSFISSEFKYVQDLMPKYIEALIKEIEETKKIIFDKAYVVRTIYIGGGTPTVLSSEQLEQILSHINYPVSEFTVECGRPDTITKDKLDVLKKYGVTRISINPQTFVDATLKRIGRKHTVKDVIDAYKLALPYDFSINMDLIAGLPGEGLRSFKKSIKTALELAPGNITVHTLALKNGSTLIQNQESIKTDETEQMVEYARAQLLENGYEPYYLYKLKNQSSGQENVGYFRDKVCIFNIDSMEECCTILACGANAISKRIFNYEKRIERFANVKDTRQYIDRIDEMIEKKRLLFK